MRGKAIFIITLTLFLLICIPLNEVKANYIPLRAINWEVNTHITNFGKGAYGHYEYAYPALNIYHGRNSFWLGSESIYKGGASVTVVPYIEGSLTQSLIPNVIPVDTTLTINVTGIYSNGSTVVRSKNYRNTSIRTIDNKKELETVTFNFNETNNGGHLIDLRITSTGEIKFYIGSDDAASSVYVKHNVKSNEGVPLSVTVSGISEIQAQLNNTTFGLNALYNKLINIENILNTEPEQNATPFIQRISHPREATITFGNSFDLIINATGVPAYMRYRVICEDFDSGWVPEDSITITGIHQEGLKKALVMVSNNPNNPEDGVIAKDEFKFFKASI